MPLLCLCRPVTQVLLRFLQHRDVAISAAGQQLAMLFAFCILQRATGWQHCWQPCRPLLLHPDSS
jgi:hypothetical protein